MAGRCAGMLVPLNSFFPFKFVAHSTLCFDQLRWIKQSSRNLRSSSPGHIFVRDIKAHIKETSLIYILLSLPLDTRSAFLYLPGLIVAISQVTYTLGHVLECRHRDKRPPSLLHLGLLMKPGVLARELPHRLLYSIISSAGNVTLLQTVCSPQRFLSCQRLLYDIE